MARVVLEVEDAAHEPGLETPAGARVRFVHRGETTLTEAVQALEWLPGRVHAFVHGEAAEVMRSLRPWLLGDWTTSAYDN